MKKIISKIVCVISAIVLAFSMTSCEQFVNDLEELARKLNATLKGISYIMEHFDDFTNPLLGNGQITDEWVNGNLDDAFVQPDYLVNFAKGYYEENGDKKSYSNLGTLNSMEDMDRYVQSLKAAGFDAYHEAFTWDFYDVMLKTKTGKLCMALKKGDVYVQLAFFTTKTSDSSSEDSSTEDSSTESVEGVNSLEDAGDNASASESTSSGDSTSGDSSSGGEMIDSGVNAVFTIANYDLLTKKSDSGNDDSTASDTTSDDNSSSEDISSDDSTSASDSEDASADEYPNSSEEE